jgi:hypothetical protein
VRDFTETKLFGGLGTFGTSYHAGVDSVSLIALSLLAVLTGHLLFREPRLV